MTNIDTHRPGAFCWLELATTDQNAAKSFYGSLFGWSIKDLPIGPESYYTMFQLEDRDVGAAYSLRAEERSHGVPPHWIIYVAVDSADAAVEHAQKLGGKALAPAFDVESLGRMAVLQDPTGATFCVWQAKTAMGIRIAEIDGTLCWADLSTADQNLAADFYSALFGWKIVKEDEVSEHGYWHIVNGDDFIGGIPPAAHRPPNTPPHWLPYILASDCDATTAKAAALGGRVYLAPMQMEDVGRISVLADPQGAVFALFQPAEKS